MDEFSGASSSRTSRPGISVGWAEAGFVPASQWEREEKGVRHCTFHIVMRVTLLWWSCPPPLQVTRSTARRLRRPASPITAAVR